MQRKENKTENIISVKKLPPLNQRVKDLVDKYAKGSVKKFSEIINITSSQKLNRVFNIDKRNNEYPEVSTDIILSIANMLSEINTEWLITGKGEMLKNEANTGETYIQPNTDTPVASTPTAIYGEKCSDKENNISIYRLKTDYFDIERQRIPLYEVEASAGLNLIFSSQNTQTPLDYITVPNAPKCDGAISVRGDSMYPLLKAGDIICYKTIRDMRDIRFGEMYLLDIEDNSDTYLTVKYIHRSDLGEKYIKLVSENKYHADKNKLTSHIRALAIIKLTIRYNTIS